MRLFQRKALDPFKKPSSTIPCYEFNTQPPARYAKVHKHIELDESQESGYQKVVERFSDPQLQLPVGGHTGNLQDSSSFTKLSDWEKFWLSRECILRYLRASEWSVEQAINRIHLSLLWRRQFGLDNSDFLTETADALDEEMLSGKVTFLGYDRRCQLVITLKSGKQNTKPSFNQVKLIVWILEAACILSPKGSEAWTLIIDLKQYADYNIRLNNEPPPLSLAKQVLNIVQEHFPERLYKCLIFNVPNSMWTFLKLIHPLIDQISRKKILYDEPLDDHIEPDQLAAEYGGSLDFQFDHSIYWVSLKRTVTESSQLLFDKFDSLGAVIGTSEHDLKEDILRTQSLNV